MDGRIGFSAMPLRFPATAIEITGGLQIGKWMPDFDFHLRSRDLTEVDRLFQNFVAASGGRPAPLGLGGSGEFQGHLAGQWSNPDATAQFSAESARYAGVLFGSVRGSVDMRDGAFDFRPLRVYDGSATLSLEGVVRYRKDPSRPTLAATVTAKDYPVSRFLDYLDLEYPVEGRVTGAFPPSGSPPGAVSGGGMASLEDAVVWGQKVPEHLRPPDPQPGRVAFDDVRADVGGGTVGGHAEVAYEEKTFLVRAAGDGVPLESLEGRPGALRRGRGPPVLRAVGLGVARGSGSDRFREADARPLLRAGRGGRARAAARGAGRARRPRRHRRRARPLESVRPRAPSSTVLAGSTLALDVSDVAALIG